MSSSLDYLFGELTSVENSGTHELISVPLTKQPKTQDTCVAVCVNCHRTRETVPRWPDETKRNVLCAQCRTPYLYGERK
jgi:hypothetical protein